MMEQQECYYKDTSFAYIDEKLQSVLGDVRNDFKGVFSPDNLGPKFGVYGTFLPTYQRFPTQPRKTQYQGISRDSPTSILQTMTCSQVTGGLLLSPLPEKLLTLSRNKKLLAKNDLPRMMPDTEKQSSQGKKKLTERRPGSKDEPSVSPFIIEEDWICCDKCQKWRLLPYGTKPEQLPESWTCSILNWLPGMNRCDISEEDTTRALHALYQVLILNSIPNHDDGSGSFDVKAHYAREISVKKRKLRDQDYLITSQCNGNHMGGSDANAFEREVSGESGFRKQKKSKVFQTEKRESSSGKGEEKSSTRGANKYRVKHQSGADFGMIRKQVFEFPRKKALGYGKEVRTCIAIW